MSLHGIEDKDIKGTGKNKRIIKEDYIRAIKKMLNEELPIVVKSDKKYISNLTGLVDLDLFILHELDAKELSHFCQTSKYVNQICHNDKYLHDKIEQFKDMQKEAAYIVNPATGRKVKIGTPLYIKLIEKYGI
ncbi:MAG TPA: hypothetical protein VLG50_06495 [Candidatus Saccharimonadales bacterium]|nr:hypothetical protein [Candidatus Saccharimonadales bacterium]